MTALENGCKQIIPVVSVEDAFSRAKSFSKNERLICGERFGFPVEGFDLGNSPNEYIKNVVENKTIILTTSNGTKALNKTKGAVKTLVLCFRNFDAVIKYLLDRPEDIVILCSGSDGDNSLEDDVCAGLLIARLLQEKPGSFKNAKVEEKKKDQALFWQNHLLGMVKKSKHGKYLYSQGFEKDLEFCSQINKNIIVPQLVENRII